MDMPVLDSKSARRISTRDLVRHPGQMMDDVMRDNLVVVQSHGRDVAALVDIKHYESLVTLLRHLLTSQS